MLYRLEEKRNRFFGTNERSMRIHSWWSL